MHEQLIERLIVILDAATIHHGYNTEHLTEDQANQVIDFIEHAVTDQISYTSQIQPEDIPQETTNRR